MDELEAFDTPAAKAIRKIREAQALKYARIEEKEIQRETVSNMTPAERAAQQSYIRRQKARDPLARAARAEYDKRRRQQKKGE